MTATPFQLACSGALAAVFANVTVFPLDVYSCSCLILYRIKTRLQTSPSETSLVSVLSEILEKDGPLGLYTGFISGISGTLMQVQSIN